MEWIVGLDARSSRSLDEAAMERILDALAPYAASVRGAAYDVGATMSVDANSARQALDSAAAAFGQAVGGRPTLTRISVQSAAEAEHELARPQMPELGGVTEFADMLGLSRQRAHDITTTRGFPAPIAELAAGPIWLRSQLETWARTHDRKPGSPRKRAAA